MPFIIYLLAFVVVDLFRLAYPVYNTDRVTVILDPGFATYPAIGFDVITFSDFFAFITYQFTDAKIAVTLRYSSSESRSIQDMCR